jgi:hypothetical protein
MAWFLFKKTQGLQALALSDCMDSMLGKAFDELVDKLIVL